MGAGAVGSHFQMGPRVEKGFAPTRKESFGRAGPRGLHRRNFCGRNSRGIAVDVFAPGEVPGDGADSEARSSRATEPTPTAEKEGEMGKLAR